MITSFLNHKASEGSQQNERSASCFKKGLMKSSEPQLPIDHVDAYRWIPSQVKPLSERGLTQIFDSGRSEIFSNVFASTPSLPQPVAAFNGENFSPRNQEIDDEKSSGEDDRIIRFICESQQTVEALLLEDRLGEALEEFPFSLDEERQEVTNHAGSAQPEGENPQPFLSLPEELLAGPSDEKIEEKRGKAQKKSSLMYQGVIQAPKKVNAPRKYPFRFRKSYTSNVTVPTSLVSDKKKMKELRWVDYHSVIKAKIGQKKISAKKNPIQNSIFCFDILKKG